MNPSPPIGHERRAGEDDRIAEHHRDDMSDWCAKELRPEIAAFRPREIEPKISSQKVNGQREPIHLGVEGDDERLENARTRPFLPAFGCEVAVHQPRDDHHADRRQAPHSDVHQTTSLCPIGVERSPRRSLRRILCSEGLYGSVIIDRERKLMMVSRVAR